MGKPGHTLQFGVVTPGATWESNVFPILQKMGIDSGEIAVMYPDDAAGQDAGPGFVKLLESKGYTAHDYLFAPNTTDYRSIVTRVKATHPAAILQGYSGAWGLPITQTVAQLQAAPAVIGVVQTPSSVPDVVAKNLKLKKFPLMWGTILAEENMSAPTTPAMKSFVSEWKAATGYDQNDGTASSSLWFYDPVGMTVKAMTEVGSVTDTKAIAAKIASSGYSGAMDWKFNSDNVALHGSDYAVEKNGTVSWTNTPIPAS
jgi:ABC-type branched-subunit amino acid transport system substrate-binding protein